MNSINTIPFSLIKKKTLLLISLIHPDYEDVLISIKNKKLHSCLLKKNNVNTSNSQTLGKSMLYKL